LFRWLGSTPHTLVPRGPVVAVIAADQLELAFDPVVLEPAEQGSRFERHRPDETVGIFVYGRAVDDQPAMALVKRSPKRTANWALASAHSRGGIVHSFSARFKTRKRSLSAASSVGK